MFSDGEGGNEIIWSVCISFPTIFFLVGLLKTSYPQREAAVSVSRRLAVLRSALFTPASPQRKWLAVLVRGLVTCLPNPCLQWGTTGCAFLSAPHWLWWASRTDHFSHCRTHVLLTTDRRTEGGAGIRRSQLTAGLTDKTDGILWSWGCQAWNAHRFPFIVCIGSVWLACKILIICITDFFRKHRAGLGVIVRRLITVLLWC